MKYELWDVVEYGEGEEPIPFTKINESNNFYELYKQYAKEAKKRPCVIVVQKDNRSIK